MFCSGSFYQGAPEGGIARPLSEVGLRARAPVYSPDGRLLAFFAPDSRSFLFSAISCNVKRYINHTLTVEKTAEAALQADIFGTVTVEVTNPTSWQIDVKILIQPPGDTESVILLTSNGQNWVSQANNPAYVRTN